MINATVTISGISTPLLLNKDEGGYYLVFYPDALPNCKCGCDNWMDSFNDECELVCRRCGEVFSVTLNS
jgi:hypothetical protein